MQQPNRIVLEYDESNEKWYVFVDDEWIGKHYTLDEAFEGVRRRLR